MHANCALWSSEVYEVDGQLLHVNKARARGNQLLCTWCGAPGATMGCCQKECKRNFHFVCGGDAGCVCVETSKPIHGGGASHGDSTTSQVFCAEHAPRPWEPEPERSEIDPERSTAAPAQGGGTSARVARMVVRDRQQLDEPSAAAVSLVVKDEPTDDPTPWPSTDAPPPPPLPPPLPPPGVTENVYTEPDAMEADDVHGDVAMDSETQPAESRATSGAKMTAAMAIDGAPGASDDTCPKTTLAVAPATLAVAPATTAMTASVTNGKAMGTLLATKTNVGNGGAMESGSIPTNDDAGVTVDETDVAAPIVSAAVHDDGTAGREGWGHRIAVGQEASFTTTTTVAEMAIDTDERPLSVPYGVYGIAPDAPRPPAKERADYIDTTTALYATAAEPSGEATDETGSRKRPRAAAEEDDGDGAEGRRPSGDASTIGGSSCGGDAGGVGGPADADAQLLQPPPEFMRLGHTRGTKEPNQDQLSEEFQAQYVKAEMTGSETPTAFFPDADVQSTGSGDGGGGTHKSLHKSAKSGKAGTATRHANRHHNQRVFEVTTTWCWLTLALLRACATRLIIRRVPASSLSPPLLCLPTA